MDKMTSRCRNAHQRVSDYSKARLDKAMREKSINACTGEGEAQLQQNIEGVCECLSPCHVTVKQCSMSGRSMANPTRSDLDYSD